MKKIKPIGIRSTNKMIRTFRKYCYHRAGKAHRRICYRIAKEARLGKYSSFSIHTPQQPKAENGKIILAFPNIAPILHNKNIKLLF